MRLIDANALKVKGFADHDTGEGIVFVQDIDEAPTVDAVEVVHGRWIKKEQKDHPFSVLLPHCSECGALKVQDTANYCPNCGAKMMDIEKE